MSIIAPVAVEPIADPGFDPAAYGGIFDVSATVLSQYANSPVLMEIINRFASAFDVGAVIDAFYAKLFNIRTATGYGLDVIGRIVGVNRVLKIPVAIAYLGFAQQAEAQAFGFGSFYKGVDVTQNYALTDDAYRQLIFAKCALNISDGSIPSINSALRALFPTHGNCYVQDNGGMAMTYVFGSALSPVELAIVSQAGVLPKPIGVSVSGQVAS